MTQIGPYEVLYAYQGDDDVIFLQTEDCAYGITPAHPLWLAYQEAGIDTHPPRPSEFHDIWDGSDWELNQEKFTPYLVGKISSHRELLEMTVVTYGEHSSYCNKESETGLNECINNIMDNGGSKEISWEGPNGYTVADMEDLSGLRKTVVDYRQKTRDAERLTLGDHDSTPFTNVEDAILAFDAHMED